ncbi:MAG: cupin domain-containing protein [Candidatus Promineifilaceae bacterium]|nr:cupin domain-containing protein [Candidatus Promineifilaceae bacterium]
MTEIHTGTEIENPITGERIVFRQTPEETDGRLLKFDIMVEPGGFPTTEHVHPAQSEHFEVNSGRLRLQQAGEETVYEAGEEATIPPGTPHMWWNSSQRQLEATVELRPAGRFASFITSLFALAQAGRTDDQGMPNLLQLAVLMGEYGDSIYPSSPPRPIQKALFAVLAPIGRALGYRADYDYPLEDAS